jgi:hypothetical protein
LTLGGTPVALANGLRTDHGFVPAEFDLSNDGVLVHQSGGRTADERRLGVIDAAGNVTPISDERRAFQVRGASSVSDKPDREDDVEGWLKKFGGSE